jgi:hypothetical protein
MTLLQISAHMTFVANANGGLSKINQDVTAGAETNI